MFCTDALLGHVECFSTTVAATIVTDSVTVATGVAADD